MAEHLNLDSILIDSSGLHITGDADRPINWSDTPNISEDVTLKPSDADLMLVKINWISHDHGTYRGTVTQGYYPADMSKQIDIGAKVEFSKIKITGIERHHS